MKRNIENIDCLKGDIYIFGAQSTSTGVIRAINETVPDCCIRGVVVSDLKNNPSSIDGYKVKTISELVNQIGKKEAVQIKVLIATTAYVQDDIEKTLRSYGISEIIRLTSTLESALMKNYYDHLGMYPSVYSLKHKNSDAISVSAYILEVHSKTDYKIKTQYDTPAFTNSFWGGLSDPTDDGFILDASGDNIADRNKKYCELTGYYWLWKNISLEDYDYIGVSQYRRFLNLSENDFRLCKENSVDVILPYPMIILPDISYHHKRYISDVEWNAMLQAMGELFPDYMLDYTRIFSGSYMYNYNIAVMNPCIFDEYSEWLFKVSCRTEDIIKAEGIKETDRYMGYIGENLLTWFFMHNESRLNIRHAERSLRI